MFVYKNKHLSSFFSPQFLPQGPCRPSRAPVGAVGSVVRVRTSTQNTSMQKVKTNPYRYNFKVLASKMRIQLGTGSREKNRTKNPKRSIISQHLVTEHTNLLQVF